MLEISTLATSVIMQLKEFSDATEALAQDGDLAGLASAEGQLDPIITYPGGSSRESILALSLLYPAIRMAKVQPVNSEGEFCDLVLGNFASLKRAMRGEPVEITTVHGLNGISLPQDACIRTPWGIIIPIPEEARASASSSGAAPTSAVLIGKKPSPVRISRDGAPEAMVSPDFQSLEEHIRTLLPLAFVLGIDGGRHGAPGLTFSTRIVPFASGFGAGRRTFGHPREVLAVEEGQIAGIERWARLIEANHTPSLNIAARKLGSAISERYDVDDRLIDGVICWESLVGTSSETLHRVTTALAILLETNIGERPQLVKKLKETYDARSKVVHGTEVSETKRRAAADHSVEIAVRALRLIYSAGSEWTEGASESRANRIILGEWAQLRSATEANSPGSGV
ncbi:HEPN domain-containing protein [Sinomonas sp. ASV322]|uniref:HEPN domain-containing protein n=1 Tax=Sinomonas sp. ASV322 TaxID=3041920 RepID=UPI0027DB4980|nr:HEPN domain-containing protein [Sinomonas sp. ASV322]MDQ4502205.1 HEPN domain-containing protein [Sinomonas sp. ASV322]